MSRIVITGASGFVGSAILSAARDRGHEVVGLSTRNTRGWRGSIFTIPTPWRRISGRQMRSSTPPGSRMCLGPRLAMPTRSFAPTPMPSIRCRQPRLVRTSVTWSFSVQCPCTAVPMRTESTRKRPAIPPALCIEQAGRRTACCDVAAQHQLGLTILRLATVYGEGDRGNIARLMRTIDAGRFVWVGRGTNRKSLIHRDDAAAAVLAVVSTGASGIRTFNVSADPGTDV